MPEEKKEEEKPDFLTGLWLIVILVCGGVGLGLAVGFYHLIVKLLGS